MMLLEQPERPQSLDATCVLGRVGELASGQGMFVDGDGAVSALCSVGSSFCVIVRLATVSKCLRRLEQVSEMANRTLIKGEASMAVSTSRRGQAAP